LWPLPDFWRNSGFHLLERDPAGRLRVTDDFLRAYFLRPEIHPVEESCEAELRLHASLMQAPRREVSAAQIEALEDQDARHNYRMLLGFRDRLLAAGTGRTPVVRWSIDGVHWLRERHSYAGASHGFGVRASNHSPSATWIDRFAEWLADRKFITP